MKNFPPPEIRIDYASDDSAEIQLWTKGHYEDAIFLSACEKALYHWDRRVVSLSGNTVSREYWRSVSGGSRTTGAGTGELMHIKAQRGQGAYPVTVLVEWQALSIGEKKITRGRGLSLVGE